MLLWVFLSLSKEFVWHAYSNQLLIQSRNKSLRRRLMVEPHISCGKTKDCYAVQEQRPCNHTPICQLLPVKKVSHIAITVSSANWNGVMIMVIRKSLSQVHLKTLSFALLLISYLGLSPDINKWVSKKFYFDISTRLFSQS